MKFIILLSIPAITTSISFSYAIMTLNGRHIYMTVSWLILLCMTMVIKLWPLLKGENEYNIHDHYGHYNFAFIATPDNGCQFNGDLRHDECMAYFRYCAYLSTGQGDFKVITIGPQPVYYIELTNREVHVLMKIAKAHYDSVCRHCAEVGGVIYGWNNLTSYVEDGDEVPACKASSHDIDVLAKILNWILPEMSEEDQVFIRRLRFLIGKAVVQGEQCLNHIL